MRLWDSRIQTDQVTLEDYSDSIKNMIFSPDGQQLASGSYDNTVRLWDSQTGVYQATLKGHSSYVRTIVYSPDGHQLASSSDDKTVRLWNIKRGRCTQIVEKGKHDQLSFSTDSSCLVIGGRQVRTGTLSLEQYCSKELQEEHSYSLDDSGQWVLYKDKEVLWIPEDRRPGVVAVWQNVMALGSPAGRVTFLFLKVGCPLFV